MEKDISKLKDEEKDLGIKETDALVLAGKGLLSLIPVIGSILSELIAFSIPKQRIDRLEKFTKSLSLTIYNLPEATQKIFEENLKDPQSLPFITKVLKQVIESESDEKIKYLASIIKNGLTKDIDLINRERLLFVASQLNEIEILRLYGASLDRWDNSEKYDAFFGNMQDALIYDPEWDATEEDNERGEILKSYSRNLVQMNLMTKTSIDGKTTSIGKSILKFIDAEENINV